MAKYKAQSEHVQGKISPVFDWWYKQNNDMNVQQQKYIVALNRFRNFARAAEACQIS